MPEHTKSDDFMEILEDFEEARSKLGSAFSKAFGPEVFKSYRQDCDDIIIDQRNFLNGLFLITGEGLQIMSRTVDPRTPVILHPINEGLNRQKFGFLAKTHTADVWLFLAIMAVTEDRFTFHLLEGKVYGLDEESHQIHEITASGV